MTAALSPALFSAYSMLAGQARALAVPHVSAPLSWSITAPTRTGLVLTVQHYVDSTLLLTASTVEVECDDDSNEWTVVECLNSDGHDLEQIDADGLCADLTRWNSGQAGEFKDVAIGGAL